MDRILDEYGLIVCGWSGEWDRALRAAFIRAPNRRYSIYWATRGAPAAGAQELIRHRGAKEVSIASADEFFKSIQQRVETLQQTHRQNPLTVDLLVSSAKRFVSRPEYKISLDELFSEETERLVAQLEQANFLPHAQWSSDEFKSRVQTYEALTEPLARMASVLGRWGDGKEFPLVLDIVRTLYQQAEVVGSGLVVWLGLRSYPAVLLFTAYGLGLVRAQRWRTLHAFFVSSLQREDRESKRLVSTLFLWTWRGQENDVWKHWEGLDRRRTPLSDHLLDVMTGWRKSFVGVEPNFELLFERFEILGSLAYFEEYEERHLEEKAAQAQDGFIEWMPVGRAGWHRSTLKALVHDLEDESHVAALLDGGFAKKSKRFLQLFIENLRRFARRMSW